MDVFSSLNGVKLFLVVSLVSFNSCYEQQRRPSRYLIPNGYAGWVQIDFGVQGAPELPIEDGYYLLKFPPTGHIKTSTRIEFGSAKDEFYYYSDDAKQLLASTGWGKGGMIWAGANSAEQGPENNQSYMYFFVGTEEEYKNYGVNVERDKLNVPKAGPINTGITKP